MLGPPDFADGLSPHCWLWVLSQTTGSLRAVAAMASR